MNGLQAMAVGIDHVGGVEVLVVLRPQARLAVVGGAESKRAGVESVDGGAAGRLEGDVHLGLERRRRVATEPDPEPRLRPAGGAVAGVGRPGQQPAAAERLEDAVIKRDCAFEIDDAQGQCDRSTWGSPYPPLSGRGRKDAWPARLPRGGVLISTILKIIYRVSRHRDDDPNTQMPPGIKTGGGAAS